ncbi:MAG TPA: hypothetical protein PKD31_20350, partial [Blastocatellia bacterium]|nr:hypothetical protein [Blastocatellia bacterium]
QAQQPLNQLRIARLNAGALDALNQRLDFGRISLGNVILPGQGRACYGRPPERPSSSHTFNASSRLFAEGSQPN